MRFHISKIQSKYQKAAARMARGAVSKRVLPLLLAGVLAFEPGAFSFFDASDGGAAGISDRGVLGGMTAYAASWQGVVKATNLNVRSGPGTGYSSVDTLGNNTSVTVVSQTTGTDGQTWYQISYGNGKTGYARHDFIKEPTVYSASDSSFEAWMTQQGFPDSYKNELRGLHQQYPNWVFKAQHTGLDWNTVIAEQSKVGRNLVYKTSKSSWKSIAQGAFDWANNSWPGFDGAAWQAASSEIISYYMDPRNFLSEPYIYQFELQSYDPSTQTKEGLEKIVEGTFLAGTALVPADGSQIEGGEIVEVAVGSTSGVSGTDNSGTPSGSGSTANGTGVGPGYSSTGSSGTEITGPGVGNVGTGGTASAAGPDGVQNGSVGGVVLQGPAAAINLNGLWNGLAGSLLSGVSSLAGRLSAFLSDGISAAFSGITAYAGAWKQDGTGWWYQNDDGSYPTGWQWLDGNGDGTAECYYFYDNGYMAANTEVDGYLLNADGQWTHHDGTVYTKQVSAGSLPGQGGSGVQTVRMKKVPYTDILMKAAEKSGVSPYVLASMIIQEQGRDGKSDLISGTSSSYPGYYNFFNIGAYAHDGMSAVTAGLKYASESGNGDRPWNSIEKAIIGGACAYGENYVSAGQDTFYLKKFNVQGSNKYNHQYMTNVPAAANEGAKVAEAYSSAVKATSLEFKIPVYENMPENPCPQPTGDGNPNNKLKSITVDGFTMTPTFNMDTASYDLIVDTSVASVNISAQTIDGNAKVTGTGTVSLNNGLNSFVLTVTAQNGSVREYKLNINRREGGQTGTGSQMGAGGQSGTGDQTGTGNQTGAGAAPSGTVGPGSSTVSPGVSGTPAGGTADSSGPGGSSVIIIG